MQLNAVFAKSYKWLANGLANDVLSPIVLSPGHLLLRTFKFLGLGALNRYVRQLEESKKLEFLSLP